MGIAKKPILAVVVSMFSIGIASAANYWERNLQPGPVIWVVTYLDGWEVIETKDLSPGSDTVMYLLKSPPDNSMVNYDDDGGEGLESRIALTGFETGYYTIFVRSYSTNSYGTADLHRRTKETQ